VNDSRYQVLNTDFDKGVITILVDVFKKNTRKINVNFQLVNSAKMCADDDYGTFTIYTPLDAENRVLAEDETSIEVEVIEARDVYVTLNLKTGYIFKGYKHAAYNAQETTLDANNTFLLIADFNPSVHYGDYLILIDKISINATLDVTDLEAQYYINGKTELSGLYVGSTIEFSNVDVDTERLGCFYYTYVDGETKTVYLTEDGTSTDENLTTSLTITSEFLETTKLLETQDKTIKFGVVAINRYKLNIVLLGSEYLAENGFTTNYCDASGASCVIEEEYKLGDYCDAGTQITFSVIPLNVGKYNVEFDGNIYNSINSGEKVITLDKDYTYVIKITPKTFVVSLDEYVYNDLYQVIEGNPELVESGHVNNMQHQGQNYKDNAEIEFVRNASDRQLSAIYISGNDNVDQYIIVFDGENFVVYLNDIEEDNIVYLTEYAITLTAYGTIKLTYTTNNDISLRLEYKDYKFINVG